MTATSEWWVAGQYTKAGKAEGYGSTREPRDTATVPGDSAIAGGQAFSIAAATNFTVYDSAVDGPFERFLVRLTSAGYCRIACIFEDAASAGTKQHVQHMPDLSCGVPRLIDSDASLTITAAADMNALDVNGYPALWSNGAAVAAKLRKIVMRNTSADTAVTGERVLHN